jgi:alkaline phosphatase D
VVAAVAAVAAVLACQPAPAAPTPPVGGAPAPTPCIDPFACQATPVTRTLPPIPTATPDPNATPIWTADPRTSLKIAVGSCFLDSRGGTALADIAEQGPDLMLWLGDNVYADATDMTLLRTMYDTLGGNPRFAALRDSVDMMATWDDHDYGNDNANGSWPLKEASKAEFLRFWGAGEDDPRWDQPGVYSSRTFGEGDRTVQVILLDNRYNLDPWDYEGIDPNRQVLGDVQWAWLRERLLEPATIRIIGSGVQVVQDYDISDIWEAWGDSPLQRERLFRLIRELRVPGVLFVSGDMHFAELSRHPDDAMALGYPTWDLTASGLDRIETENPGEWNNPYRVGGLLNSHRKHGVIGIDWATDDPQIHLQIWDGRALFLDQVIRLSELQPD